MTSEWIESTKCHLFSTRTPVLDWSPNRVISRSWKTVSERRLSRRSAPAKNSVTPKELLTAAWKPCLTLRGPRRPAKWTMILCRRRRSRKHKSRVEAYSAPKSTGRIACKSWSKLTARPKWAAMNILPMSPSQRTWDRPCLARLLSPSRQRRTSFSRRRRTCLASLRIHQALWFPNTPWAKTARLTIPIISSLLRTPISNDSLGNRSWSWIKIWSRYHGPAKKETNSHRPLSTCASETRTTPRKD